MKRRLGPVRATSLVVASMIGVGVFTTSGFALADLGSREAVLAAWIVGGLVATCGAVSYGALARRFPVSGGEYAYLREALHPFAGVLAGWVSLLAGFTAPIAVAALALAAYVSPLLGGADGRWLGTAAIAAAGILHGRRVVAGLRLQTATVALKLFLIAAFVLFGVAAMAGRTTAPAPGPSAPFDATAFLATLVWISFAYSGWNAAVYVGEEVRDPERTLPRALLFGTLLVTLAYVALNAVFLYAAPPAALAGRADVAAAAAGALGGRPLQLGVTAIIALALLTSISAMVLAGPRVLAKMAAEGDLPRLLAADADAPSVAVAVQSALAIALVWSSGLRELLATLGFVLGLSSAASVVALFVVRRREGATRVPVPGYPFVPAFYVFATLLAAGALAARDPAQLAAGALFVLAVFAVWRFGERPAAPEVGSPARRSQTAV